MFCFLPNDPEKVSTVDMSEHRWRFQSLQKKSWRWCLSCAKPSSREAARREPYFTNNNGCQNLNIADKFPTDPLHYPVFSLCFLCLFVLRPPKRFQKTRGKSPEMSKSTSDVLALEAWVSFVGCLEDSCPGSKVTLVLLGNSAFFLEG